MLVSISIACGRVDSSLKAVTHAPLLSGIVLTLTPARFTSGGRGSAGQERTTHDRHEGVLMAGNDHLTPDAVA